MAELTASDGRLINELVLEHSPSEGELRQAVFFLLESTYALEAGVIRAPILGAGREGVASLSASYPTLQEFTGSSATPTSGRAQSPLVASASEFRCASGCDVSPVLVDTALNTATRATRQLFNRLIGEIARSVGGAAAVEWEAYRAIEVGLDGLAAVEAARTIANSLSVEQLQTILDGVDSALGLVSERSSAGAVAAKGAALIATAVAISFQIGSGIGNAVNLFAACQDYRLRCCGFCGNGFVEGAANAVCLGEDALGEVCDGEDCPLTEADCDDNDPDTIDRFVQPGNLCTAQCVYRPCGLLCDAHQRCVDVGGGQAVCGCVPELCPLRGSACSSDRQATINYDAFCDEAGECMYSATSEFCGAGELCESGVCACSDDVCTIGETACAGESRRVCERDVETQCIRWVETNCGPNETCGRGECRAALSVSPLYVETDVWSCGVPRDETLIRFLVSGGVPPYWGTSDNFDNQTLQYLPRRQAWSDHFVIGDNFGQSAEVEVVSRGYAILYSASCVKGADIVKQIPAPASLGAGVVFRASWMPALDTNNSPIDGQHCAIVEFPDGLPERGTEFSIPNPCPDGFSWFLSVLDTLGTPSRLTRVSQPPFGTQATFRWK